MSIPKQYRHMTPGTVLRARAGATYTVTEGPVRRPKYPGGPNVWTVDVVIDADVDWPEPRHITVESRERCAYIVDYPVVEPEGGPPYNDSWARANGQ